MSEAFNRAHIAADYPVYGDPDVLPAWAATDDRLEATQSDADAAAKRFWQRSSWYRRASIRSQPLAGQPLMDELAPRGRSRPRRSSIRPSRATRWRGAAWRTRRSRPSPRRSIVFLDLPDAVFRGYANDEELLNTPRADDRAPYELLRREIARLEPQKLYLPLGIGNHVDHQLCRDVGVRLLAEGRRWVMPGPDYAGIVDVLRGLPLRVVERLQAAGRPARRLRSADLPPDVALAPDYADIGDQLERKITGITIYESQIERLFTSPKEMARQVRAHARKTALLGGDGGSAERYWSTGPA